MFKKLLIVTLSITAFLCCAFFPKSFNVSAETSAEKQNITYVAFGDSIAEGYAINMKTKLDSDALIKGADTSYDLVEGSYVDLIRDELDKTYKTTAYNFAYSGDTCQDLLNFIAEFYDDKNNMANDSGVANPTYPSLTNGQLYNDVKSANIITVCIGANNILQESKNLMVQYIDNKITIADMENKLKDKIVGYTDTETGQHVNGFYDEFGNLLTILYKLNKDATIYFTSIYNPYKSIIVHDSLTNYISQSKLNKISNVAEIAIAGGKDSSGNNYVGINNVIYDAINSFNESSNFKFVDSKSNFDANYSEDNKENYNDYVNVHFKDITINSIMSGEVNLNDLSSVMDKYCDPHPTYKGHKLIANAHIKAWFNHKTKVNSSTLQSSYNLQEGQSLEFDTSVINTIVDNSNYSYSYTYTIKKDEATVSTITNNPATINYSDYETGSYEVYLSIQAQNGSDIIDICTDEQLTTICINEVQKFTVSFVTNCDDVIGPQEIVSGGKVTDPSVSKPNHELVGWFTDEEFTSQWNFETDVVLSNITLYAKWQAITFDVTFDYNGGTLNGQNSLVVAVIQNGLVEKPSSNSEPTLSKHRLFGWFVNLSDEQPFDFNTPITGALTLHAKWEKVVFTVTFNYNGGIFNGESQKVVEVNKGNKLPMLSKDPVKEDCKLVGWFKDVDLWEEPWDFENDVVNADVTIFAKWESNVVYVTLDYQGGIFNVNGNINSRRVLKFEKGAELSTPTEGAATLLKSGYKFAYWYLTNDQVPLEFPLNVYEDITINAYWKEAIKINIYYYSQDIEWLIFKGTKAGELYDEIKPQKNGTRFLGWYEDASLTTEFEDDTVLENNQNVFIKWITLKCVNESLLKQAYSPITKLIEWKIDAKNGTKLAWQVNNEIVKYAVVTGNEGESWTFAPTAVGTFEISCLIYDEVDQDEKPIGGTVVNGKTVEIVYSTPTDITISLTKVINKKTYVIEVDNRQYYDESKFAWFKTSDGFSNEFSTKIGVGFDLNYKFDSDCKICVKYLENEDSTDGLVSNIINVKVDNYVDETTLFSIVISLAVVALLAVGVIISRKKYKDFF